MSALLRTQRPCVVMRARDDMPLIRDTLAALRAQTIPCEIHLFDNASRDGSAEVGRQLADAVHPVPAGAYVPGQVLNQGMETTSGEVVVFLNADCTPMHPDWLERLLAGFDAPAVAAVFGRQIPRPGCRPLLALDIEQTFGDGQDQARWRHCFSMAASAVRRSAWQALRFDDALRYSEDVDFTWRARQAGFEVRYAPDAVVAHSHDYDLAALWRRQAGEGEAEARIFPWTPWRASLLRYSALPLARKVAADWRALVPAGDLGEAAWAPLVRLVQAAGRRQGFNRGRRRAA